MTCVVCGDDVCVRKVCMYRSRQLLRQTRRLQYEEPVGSISSSGLFSQNRLLRRRQHKGYFPDRLVSTDVSVDVYRGEWYWRLQRSSVMWEHELSKQRHLGIKCENLGDTAAFDLASIDGRMRMSALRIRVKANIRSHM